MTRAHLALLAFALLVACGDDDGATPDAGAMDAGAEDAGALDAGPSDAGGGEDGGSEGDLARDFCEPLAALVCERADTCGCGALLPGGGLDRAACTARIAAQCTTAWTPLSAGGARVLPERAAACVERIAELTPGCEAPGDAIVLAYCEPFVVSDAAIGEACASPFCAGGEGTCAEGECVARGAAGATCDSPLACATGLLCTADDTCAEPGGESAACGEDVQCAAPLRCVGGACRALGALEASCGSTAECGALLVCDEGACAEGATETCSPTDACGNLAACGAPRACVARGTAGTSCEEARDCDPAYFCDSSTDVCALRAGAGEACSDGIHCAPGLGCDLEGDGTCRALPGSGSACLFGEDGPVLCAEGLACVGGTCGPLPTEGQPCAIDNRCAEGLGCDFSPAGSFCIVPRGVGGACESDRSCAAELHCAGTTCVADLPAGAECSVGNECAGACVPGPSGGLVCADAPGEGERCLFDDDCGEARQCARDLTMSRCLPEICEVI